MPLNYKAFQSNIETKEGKRLWFPVLVKDGGTITLPMIAKRIASKSSLTPGDVYNVVYSLIDELNDKLLNGHSVCLNEFGTFTVIAKAGGNGVETPQAVNASQIKSLRVQFTPSYKRTPFQGVTRAMFDGVEFQRWKGDPYHPDNDKTGGNSTGGNNNDDDGGFTPDPNA